MEKLAIYDKDNHLKESFAIRGTKPACGEYIKVVIIFIQNASGEYLIQKTSVSKGGSFATTGGHVAFGESETSAVLREVQEELGITLTQKIKHIGTISFETRFMEVYLVKQDVDISSLVLQTEEVDSAAYMSAADIKEKISSGEFLASHGRAFCEFESKL